MPEQIGFIAFLNTDKKVAHFNVSRNVSGYFKYEGRMARVQPSDFVALRLEERMGRDGKLWVPLSVKATQQMPSDEIYKAVSGSAKRGAEKNFGFVDDVFVSPALLLDIQDGVVLTGRAPWSFDKSKNKYGWRSIKVSVDNH